MKTTAASAIFSSEHKGIAVIGAGYWGRNLVRNYYQLKALKLICDSDHNARKQIEKQAPGVETCPSLNEVLSRDDIHGVVIATPAETHFQLAREALLAGKHVFVEKPLVLMESEAEELIKSAEELKLTLMVGHLLQYHPVFVRLKELVISGDLGRINYVYSNRLNLGKIRREENILWSFAPHDISMILSLAGEEPESILTTGGNYLHKKIADVTTTHLEFPSGLKAHIFVSWLHPYKDQKLVVVGDHKMAVFDDTQPWPGKLLLYPHEIKWQNNVPIPSKAKPDHVNDIEEVEPLRRECEHFVNCIKTGMKPLTDGHEGLRVLRILNASQRSLDEYGRKMFLHEKDAVFVPEKPVKQVARDTLKETSTSYFVHPTAIIDDDVAIGKDTNIWHFSHVLSGSKVGAHCNIGQNVMIGPDAIIGKNCKIQNNVSVYKGVVLEEGVFCGPSMVFTNVYNPRAEIRKMDEMRPTLVKKSATIGANATIVCGNTIGRYAFIGAGAVVTKNVADYALVIGNPGKQTGWVCECGKKLPSILLCENCKKQYRKTNKGLSKKNRSKIP